MKIFSVFFSIAMMIVSLPAVGVASTVLTLDQSGIEIFQQTNQSPCIFGDPSCKQKYSPTEDALPYTVFDQNPAGGVYMNVLSPIYSVALLRAIVGNTFSVGIDVNTATGQPVEFLTNFSMFIGDPASLEFYYPAGGSSGTALINHNNGTGYSDSLLTGFDLTGFDAADPVRFSVSYSSATDGRENFFLVSSLTPPAEIPEPVSLILIGTGLLFLAHFGSRRLRSRATFK